MTLPDMNIREFTLFSELYTCYYEVIDRILHETAHHLLTPPQMHT